MVDVGVALDGALVVVGAIERSKGAERNLIFKVFFCKSYLMVVRLYRTHLNIILTRAIMLSVESHNWFSDLGLPQRNKHF